MVESSDKSKVGSPLERIHQLVGDLLKNDEQSTKLGFATELEVREALAYMKNMPRLSDKESIILYLLLKHGEMYGLEIVRSSDDLIPQGTVYTTLQRMQAKGYVVPVEKDNSNFKGIGLKPVYYRASDKFSGKHAVVFKIWLLLGEYLFEEE